MAKAPKKGLEIDSIQAALKESPSFILTDYRGLDVTQLATLRGQLRPVGVTFRVVKNFVEPDRLEARLRRLGWDCAIRRDGNDWVRGEARPAQPQEDAPL